uniref:shugoshin-1 n=1 Tax=Erigeron canadensis TaxID=72917 RepID=UPI001CB9CF10|nr:shugoshin-1 [Erigeron canadensis]
MIGERMAKRSSFGKSIRKRLSDITNYQPQQPKSSLVFDQVSVFNDLSSSTKEHIDHLLKENAGLLKLITEKNKVIELNGVELQKLRVALQKTQLQNLGLAQSNSHMMAELNLGKQKLKSLQHQLTCKDALLKTMNLELQAARVQKKVELQDGDDVDTNQRITYKHMRPVRSQSMGSLMATVQRVPKKEAAENKRRCVRRQSAKFGSQASESEENLFEIEDLKMHEDGPTLKASEQNEGQCGSKPEPRGSQRMSFGRPSRRAAEKVQSYKETPINIKMRRPE